MKKLVYALHTLLAVCLMLPLNSCTKDPVESLSFELNPTKIEMNKASFDVRPSDNTRTYYSAIVKASEFTSDQDVVQSWINEIREDAEERSISYTEMANKKLSVGTQTLSFDGLMPTTDYYVYAFFIDSSEDAALTVDFQAFTKVRFTTEKVPEGTKGFNIIFSELTATSVTVEISPLTGDPAYWAYYIDQAMYEKYNLEDPDAFCAFVKKTLDYNAGWMEIPVEDLVKKQRQEKYTINEFADLAPATVYYAFAAEIDDSGNVIDQNFSVAEFTTKEPIFSDLVIDMKVTTSTATTVTVEYRPSDLDKTWFTYYMTKVEFDNFKDDKAVMDAAMELFGPFIKMGQGLYSGEGRLTHKKLSPTTEYVFFAFGYDAKNKTYNSALFTALGTTQEAEEVDDNDGVTFKFDINVIDYCTAEITTTPSDTKVTYITDVIDKYTYDSYGGTPTGLKEFWKNQLEEFKEMGMPAADAVLFLGVKGKDKFKYETLLGKTDHVVFAIHVDEIGRIKSKISVDFFTTPEKPEPGKAMSPYGDAPTFTPNLIQQNNFRIIIPE